MQPVVQGNYFLGTLLALNITSKLYVFVCVCECVYVQFYEEKFLDLHQTFEEACYSSHRSLSDDSRVK